MADERFPRPNLNPSAAPWARAVEKRLQAAEKALGAVDGKVGGHGRILTAIKGRKGADGLIYRRNGVVVPVGSEDFTIYAGTQADQGQQYDESGEYLSDGAFASLNVQPTVAAMRAYDAFHQLYGYARLTGKAFDVSWGTAQNITVSHDLSEVDDTSRHWAIKWEYDAPGGTFDEQGFPVTTKLYGSLFDGAIGVTAHQDWTPSDTPGVPPSPQPVVFDGIFIGGAIYEGGGGTTVVAATTTVAGIVELATDAEAAAGTDTARAVTPHALAAALVGAGQNLADAWRGDWVAP